MENGFKPTIADGRRRPRTAHARTFNPLVQGSSPCGVTLENGSVKPETAKGGSDAALLLCPLTTILTTTGVLVLNPFPSA